MAKVINKMSLDEYLKRKKSGGSENKYHAKKVEIDGIIFDSEVEGMQYRALKQDLADGKIKRFIPHCPVELIPPFPYIDGGKSRSLGKTLFYPDFVIFHHDWTIEVMDVKARRSRNKDKKSITKTPEFLLKFKSMKYRYRLEDNIKYTIVEM